MQVEQERKKAMMEELKHFIRAEIKSGFEALKNNKETAESPKKAKREKAVRE